MKHALTWISGILVLVMVAAACANADASQKPANPAQLRQSAKALSHVHSFGFHATVTLNVSGTPTGSAAPASALAGKATTLDITGHASKSGKSGVFDAKFTLENSLLPIDGEVRATGGHTVYIKLPVLLGSGWKSYTVKPGAFSHHKLAGMKTQSKDATSAALGLKRLNPLSLLSNVTQSDNGSVRTLSADLNPAKLVAAVESLAAGSHRSHAREIGMLGSAIKVAHGSVSVDTHTHLPTAVSTELQMTTPRAMVRRAMGITGFDLKIDVTFDGWNQPVHVSTPAGATPLRLGSHSMLSLSGLR
jgi:hypothetical protein